MRGRLSFALTAFTLLFLLQGWSALLATTFATAYDAIFPSFNAVAALPLIVPLLALAAPLLRFSRLIERRIERRDVIAARRCSRHLRACRFVFPITACG